MASTNFKLFDENKANMMSDTEYNINAQRLNGVQAGIASSQLQNKTLYQTSLVAYSLAQIMMQNGYDANDSAAVSAFVGNMSNSLLQKVLDKATTTEAQNGVNNTKWMTPALTKAAIDILAAKSQNILSDSTKTLFGLGTNAVPNDVLHLLSRFQSGLGNEYIWAKSQYHEIKTASSLSFPGTEASTMLCSNQITIDSSGNISLSNPETYTFTQIANNVSIVKGKYVFYHPDSYHGDDKTKYIDETAEIGFSTGGHSFVMNVVSGGYFISSQLELVSYVNSPSPDSYPPAVSDGYIYIPFGQLGNKVHISTGSYTGTGTKGAANPNSLTLSFPPKFLAVFPIYGFYRLLCVRGMKGSNTTPDGNQYGEVGVAWDGSTVSWYITDSDSVADYQLNRLDTQYFYFAIG